MRDRVAKAVTALGDDRALKFYKSDKGKADFEHEKEMLVKLKSTASEWVVSLLEAVQSPFILAFELLGESLAQWLDQVQRDKYFAQTAELVSVQILAAVNALHAARVIHCDLKPEQFCFRLGLPTGQVNIIKLRFCFFFFIFFYFLFTSPFSPCLNLYGQIRIKLIDLDSARVFSLSSFKPLDRFTRRNCAPEVMRAMANLGALRPDFAMDIFCVGLILLQLLHEHGQCLRPMKRRPLEWPRVAAHPREGLWRRERPLPQVAETSAG